jgi:hypothetical protein
MKNYINNQGFVSVGDTTDALYVQENVEITGSLNVSGSISYGGILIKNSRAPYLVVGNALNGDTARDCDYLDVGDGVQLQTALNIAGAGTGNPAARPDIHLRPGRITAATPITVPIQVTLKGAGGFASSIINTSTNRVALIAALRCIVEDIYVTATAPIIGCSGSELISVTGASRFHRVRVVLPSQVVGVATNESISAIIRTTTGSSIFGTQFIDCNVDGYSYRRLGLARDLTGIELYQYNAVRQLARVSNTYIATCDINLDARGPVLIDSTECTAATRIGISCSTYSDGRLAPLVSNCYVHTIDLAGTAQYGVVFGTGPNASGFLGASISDTTITTTSTNTGSIGISLSGSGTAARIHNCFVDSFVTAMTASATQTNINASGNTIRNFTNGILIQSSGSLVSNTVTV